MKETANIQFTETDSTVSLLKVALNNPPAQGFDFAVMRARGRIEDALEGLKSGDVIKLEDSDYATAVEAVKNVKWAARSKHLIQFGEQWGL